MVEWNEEVRNAIARKKEAFKIGTLEIIVLSWFHTNIVIIENFRRESVLR